MTPAAVPIVTYHSVADPHDHVYGPLSLPIELFERQLRYLHRNGFQSVTLDEVHEYLKRGTPLPTRAVALTLDDGYLDNWVHAYPLLEKYRMKATIFVVTDFVDPADRTRPTLEDAWAGRISRDELSWWGYLTWRELEAMQSSGVFDVQAHTCTHTWYFRSDRIVDFHHPGDEYYWLDWNHRPGEKHGWLNRDYRVTVPWGLPVYEYGQTLLQPRYFDDARLASHLVDSVAGHGGATFFDRAGWRAELDRLVSEFRAQHGTTGRYETDREYEARVCDEMIRSRETIAARLGKPVHFLCWPCGDYTPRLQRLAIERCGYLATVNVQKVGNRPGDDPTELRRIVFGQDYMGPWQSHLVFMNFIGSLNYHRGIRAAYPVAPVARRLMRLGRLIDRARGRVTRSS